jgi:Fe-S-cluster containining protein
MPQPRKSDPPKAAPHESGRLTAEKIKLIAGKSKGSSYFLPFCSTCTDPCCNGHILATESEYRRILSYSGGVDHFEKFQNYYVHEGDPCLYLRNGLCSIHPVRPAICRMFPYHIDGDMGDLGNDDTCPALATLYGSFRPNARRLAKRVIREMSWASFLHFWNGGEEGTASAPKWAK